MNPGFAIRADGQHPDFGWGGIGVEHAAKAAASRARSSKQNLAYAKQSAETEKARNGPNQRYYEGILRHEQAEAKKYKSEALQVRRW